MRHATPWILGLFLCLNLLASQGPFAQDPRTLRPQQEVAQPATTQVARIALVIGNGGYREVPLKNPPQDARAMAGALQACGFQVQVLVDGSLPQMEAALRVFGQRLKAGGVGLFFYAGHGMQVRGTNYLIPVGADIGDEDEIRFKALDANEVLAKMESAGNGLNLMVLDACRNNPFGRGWRRGGAEGLAQMDAPTGTYIAFATGPGRTASDGSGANGLYTQHLLEALQQPGLKVEEVFKRVRMGVKQSSHDQQVPWDSSSLTGEFYFRGGAANGSPGESPLGMNTGMTAPSTQLMKGGLQVAVTGTEAKVFLNFELKGVAKPDEPLLLAGLSTGAARLSVEAPYYTPVKQIVLIEAGRVHQVSIPMKKAMKITVYRKPNIFWYTPGEFGVFLDEHMVASLKNKEFTTFIVPSGSYTLEIRQPSYGLETQLKVDNSVEKPRFFRIDIEHNFVGLTEVTEETWKIESRQYGSQRVESSNQP
jgi:hypothetical protein